MRAVLDTNVLVYDTFEDSMFHAEASAIMDELEAWVLPLIVVYEYVWFMRGLGVDAKTTLRKVEDYTLSPKTLMVEGDRGIVRSALGIIIGEDASLSRFNDKVILLVAGRMGIPVVTFDQRLRTQAEKHKVPYYPRKL